MNDGDDGKDNRVPETTETQEETEERQPEGGRQQQRLTVMTCGCAAPVDEHGKLAAGHVWRAWNKEIGIEISQCLKCRLILAIRPTQQQVPAIIPGGSVQFDRLKGIVGGLKKRGGLN